MLFCKMFVVVYIVKMLYILCSYDLFHTLLSLWHTAGCMELLGMYVCVCVCEYMHLCKFVC
jgi:hypothetical protein